MTEISPPPPKRRRRRRYSKLSLKIARAVLGSTFAGLVVLRLLGVDISLVVIVVAPLLSGVMTYLFSYLSLARRLELARVTLREVRKRRFGNLEAAYLPPGDELNGLIRQVYRAGLTMEKELQEMRKLEDYRREFLGNVSHELKTPIFAIQGFTETLLNGALEDESANRSFLGKILNNTYRLSNLTNDLVEISRIETGELQMLITPFDLRDAVTGVLDGIESVARAKEVELKHAIPPLPAVLGDRERIRQVIVNLVDNAIKYSNPGGFVEVSARKLSDGMVYVEVSDSGIGIDPEHIPRLTERFYRVDKSRSRLQGGTGLGLAIVKHILGAHDTEMTIESRLGKGTTFGFKLNTAP